MNAPARQSLLDLVRMGIPPGIFMLVNAEQMVRSFLEYARSSNWHVIR